jgi:hypothetical protein
MSLDALIDEVRRRRTPDEALHLTAIGVLADSDLARFGDDQIALAMAGWADVRAEGATDTFPTLSAPSLALVRSGVGLTDRIYRMLPEADKANLVCIGFLGIVGERISGEQPADTPAAGPRPISRRRPKPRQNARNGSPAKPNRPRPAEG